MRSQLVEFKPLVLGFESIGPHCEQFLALQSTHLSKKGSANRQMSPKLKPSGTIQVPPARLLRAECIRYAEQKAARIPISMRRIIRRDHQVGDHTRNRDIQPNGKCDLRDSAMSLNLIRHGKHECPKHERKNDQRQSNMRD